MGVVCTAGDATVITFVTHMSHIMINSSAHIFVDEQCYSEILFAPYEFYTDIYQSVFGDGMYIFAVKSVLHR